MGLWWHQCFHTTWPIRWPQWTLSAAVVKYSCRVLSWEPALIMLDQNLMCAGAVVRTVEPEPALLSETLVLVRLTPSMGVLIAAILHKLSIEFLPKCAFFSPSPAHTALHEMSVSSHSLFPRCPSARFCPPRSSHFPFFLSVSHLSLLNLRGQLMNGFPALIGWCMMLLGGMKANITQRVWNGKGEESERVETEKCFDRRLWKQKDVHACNNGSRSQFHWCFSPGTLPLGNSPTDLIPVSSASLRLLAL